MRVRLKKADIKQIEERLIKKFSTISLAAKKLGFNRKTVDFWLHKASSMPLDKFRALAKASGMASKKVTAEVLPDFWHTVEAGKKGGLITSKSYKINFGTKAGRSAGGINSQKAHKTFKTGFYTLKKIKVPKKDSRLAELMGIIIGDGHLSKYQLSITTNSKTDINHANHAARLIKELFSLNAFFKFKKDENAVELLVSSRKLVEFLNKCGMPIGNKLKSGLSIPDWMFKNKKFLKFFIRGLFDTDGCIYMDAHKTDKKTYRYFGWTITSYSKSLREDILSALKKLDYNPTNKTSQTSVFLRKQKEIKKYFVDIGSSNSKHLARYFGEVPKWS